MKYKIEGGNKLIGRVKISGNKNSFLPCMAAALLTDQEVVLENVPQVADLEIFIRIFNYLGVKTKLLQNKIIINAANLSKEELPDDLVKSLRASILVVGPILSRRGKVSFCFPGGDIIGRRSIKTHLEGFKALGISVSKDDNKYILKKSFSKKHSIFLEEASVTGTENLILLSILQKGQIVIKNCACEPHVVDLCQMLIKMGAKIEGVGTDTLKIQGVMKLKGVNFKISDDYLEISTYAIAAAITGGRIKMITSGMIDLDPISNVLSKFGIKITNRLGSISVTNKQKLTGVDKIVTNLWPGFPTDLMSVVIVLATQAKGLTLCHDWMYENRMFFVDKLIAMGANITIADPHRVIVQGSTNLYAREMESPDIRAGMALVLAALVAKGTSIINKTELIERGYEDVVGKLSSLGAKIEQIEI